MRTKLSNSGVTSFKNSGLSQLRKRSTQQSPNRHCDIDKNLSKRYDGMCDILKSFQQMNKKMLYEQKKLDLEKSLKSHHHQIILSQNETPKISLIQQKQQDLTNYEYKNDATERINLEKADGFTKVSLVVPSMLVNDFNVLESSIQDRMYVAQNNFQNFKMELEKQTKRLQQQAQPQTTLDEAYLIIRRIMEEEQDSRSQNNSPVNNKSQRIIQYLNSTEKKTQQKSVEKFRLTTPNKQVNIDVTFQII